MVYFLVVLRKEPNWSPEVTPQVEATRAVHMANITALHAQGKLILARSFINAPDPDLRPALRRYTPSARQGCVLQEAGDGASGGGRQRNGKSADCGLLSFSPR